MLVFLDVLGRWDLKIVKIDPPSGTLPGIKILKNPPQNRKHPNHWVFRLFYETKSLGNWILFEFDTLNAQIDRPVPEIIRFLCFDFCVALRGWESTDGGAGKITSRMAENLARKYKCDWQLNTRWRQQSILDFKSCFLNSESGSTFLVCRVTGI